VAIPLELGPKNVYMAFNFESNYALPSNDSYNQWIDRVSMFKNLNCTLYSAPTHL